MLFATLFQIKVNLGMNINKIWAGNMTNTNKLAMHIYKYKLLFLTSGILDLGLLLPMSPGVYLTQSVSLSLSLSWPGVSNFCNVLTSIIDMLDTLSSVLLLQGEWVIWAKELLLIFVIITINLCSSSKNIKW